MSVLASWLTASTGSVLVDPVPEAVATIVEVEGAGVGVFVVVVFDEVGDDDDDCNEVVVVVDTVGALLAVLSVFAGLATSSFSFDCNATGATGGFNTE